MTPRVEVLDEAGLDEPGFFVSSEAVEALVSAVLQEEGSGGSVVVAFVSEDAITELNARYRSLDESTDVLSFPACSAESQSAWVPDESGDFFGEAAACAGPAVELGDIAVSPAVVFRYADEEGNTAERQLGWTLIHGALHLLGYDHETDHGEMRKREQQLLADARLADLVSRLRSGQDARGSAG